MADRAQYLARTLISRMAALDRAAADEGKRGLPREQRTQLVEKILAVELGVTDWKTVSLVESALPQIGANARPPDRELAAFAEFLRKHLARELAES